MGKAARRRKAYQMREKAYQLREIVKLSYDDPDRFSSKWEILLQAWLDEVREFAVGSLHSKHRAFEILEEALRILYGCEQSIYKKYAEKTYELISHACCFQVSRVIDPRLYRLSNMSQLAYRAKKSAKG